jgi:hypothetical protein
MNTIAGNATRSPQVKRSSVPPCRPHTPCLGARSAGISFALRLQARISALMADRFAWLSPWLRPGGSTQALQIPSRDGHPALLASRDARPPGYARLLVYASPLRGCGGTFTRKRSALLGAQPQSANNSGGQAAIEGGIEGLRGRIVGEAQDAAAANAGQAAGAGHEEEPQGTHAPDQVRIGAFA